MTDTNTLAPCPFCGAGTTVIRENGLIWQGMKYGEPSSVSVLHRCEATPGQPSRTIERVGKDRASAIAAWNRRAPTTQAAPAAQGGEEDAARLDWLEANAQTTIERLRCIGSGKRVYEVVASNDAEIYGEGDTLRAAIDAARSAQGESK